MCHFRHVLTCLTWHRAHLISISRRRSTNVRSCCEGVPSSSLQPLSLHTAPQPGGSLSPICFASHRAPTQLTSPCDSNRTRPCTRSVGACWGQLLANQSPLQCRSHPVATHSRAVTVDSHTRGWLTSARPLSPVIFVPAVLPTRVLGAVDILHLPAFLCGLRCFD